MIYESVLLLVDGEAQTTLFDLIKISAKPSEYPISEDEVMAIEALKIGEEIKIAGSVIKRIGGER